MAERKRPVCAAGRRPTQSQGEAPLSADDLRRLRNMFRRARLSSERQLRERNEAEVAEEQTLGVERNQVETEESPEGGGRGRHTSRTAV